VPGLSILESNPPSRDGKQGNQMGQEVQTINRAREQAQRKESERASFDYSASAELFLGRSKKAWGPISYKRFETGAAALRFAVEELPADVLIGTYLEVEEVRFDRYDIQYLYESPAYPFGRTAISN
jgi:hypothetical protein